MNVLYHNTKTHQQSDSWYFYFARDKIDLLEELFFWITGVIGIEKDSNIGFVDNYGPIQAHHREILLNPQIIHFCKALQSTYSIFYNLPQGPKPPQNIYLIWQQLFKNLKQ
jgi:hypothetical protein